MTTRRLLRAVIAFSWSFGWRVGIACLIVMAAMSARYYSELPPSSELLDARSRGSVVLLDRDQRVFAWRGTQYGGPVSSQEVSPYLRNAVVAMEDKRFYQHFGVSPRGILGAMAINLREGRGPFRGHGGSTITQQVGKLLCLGVAYNSSSGRSEAEFEQDCRRTTIWRKIKEVPYAMALELKYTKDEILTVYLNRVYLGAGTNGFEAASQRYFGKSVRESSPAEAAMLAGLLAAPSVYAPTRNIATARNRANLVVSLMERQGYLSVAEAAEARNSPAVLSRAAAERSGGYFADWVMESGPAFLTTETTEDISVQTTYDRKIQTAVDEAIEHVFKTKVRPGSKAQTAVVVMSRDGAVRAIAGGRDARAAGQFNRATQARRQTGSAFKPFVYAAALESGIEFDDPVEDRPVTIKMTGSKSWTPKNYKGQYAGKVSIADAFAQSSNVVAAVLGEIAGRAKVKDMASGFGIRSRLIDTPAIALGASEATLIEMTGAYAGIMNGGRSVTPYGLVELKLRSDGTTLMEKAGGIGKRVISDSTARQLTHMMMRVIKDGTGQRAALSDREAAGKTGTTQGARDAWFIGFTADYVAGVWMGYDDNTPLVGVTGGGLPAEIWREAMTRIHSGTASLPLRGLRTR